MTWIGEYFGDVMLVNGKVWPYLDVEPRMYRFRILNGCNGRILNLDLSGLNFWQIGAEGGLWDIPVRTSRLVLAPAERADVIVDFSRRAGGQIADDESQAAEPSLESCAATASGDAVPRRKNGYSARDRASIPSSLPGRAANLGSPVHTRYITLNEIDPEEVEWFLNLSAMHFEDPITEMPQVGTIEDWVYINMTGDTHPMHTHLVTFQVVGRTPFDVEAYEDAYGGPKRGAGWDRSNSVRDRPNAAAGSDRARIQGHGESKSRRVHDNPGAV